MEKYITLLNMAGSTMRYRSPFQHGFLQLKNMIMSFYFSIYKTGSKIFEHNFILHQCDWFFRAVRYETTTELCTPNIYLSK